MKFLATQPNGPPAVAGIRYLNDVVSFVCVFSAAWKC